MNLDEIGVELRSRSAYESTDLGFALGRRFWKPIYGAWLLCVLPIFAIATGVAVWTKHLTLPLLAVWLLKPAYDRLPLFVVSRGIFGDTPGVVRTAKHTLSRWNSLTVFLDCTLRRLSPYRGFLQPLRELEFQSSTTYGNRKNALLRRGIRGPAFVLLSLGLLVEQILMAGGFGLALLVSAPQTIHASSFALLVRTGEWIYSSLSSGDLPASVIVLTMGSYFVAVSLVEVFYVAGSFGLYINRRVHLEGWDVELDFKRLARRLTQSAGRAAAALIVGATVALATVALPGDLVAQPSDEPRDRARSATGTASDKDPKKVAEEVLEAPEFGDKKEKWVWVPREKEQQENEKESSNFDFGGSLAALFEIFLWIGVGVVVLVVGYAIVRYASDGESIEEPDDEEDVEPVVESRETSEPSFHLPTDLVETARRHWERDAYIESLSVLYRGTIRGLADRYDIEVEPSMTARECLRAVRDAGGPGNYVGRLGRAWTSTVYADRPPSDEDAEALFREWRRHFTRGRP